MEELYKFIANQYYILLYFLVWLVAVFRYRSYFDTPLKYFPIYLMYTFLTEVLGYLIRFHDFQFFSEERYSWHNVIIYNIYSVIAFLFFYHLYWRVLKVRKHKNWVRYGAIISGLSYGVSLFFQDPLHMSLYYADLIASMVLLVNIALYFKEKRKEEVPVYVMKHNLMFWISLGLAVFHAFYPFLFLIAFEAPKIWADYQLRQVLIILVLFMYGTFMLGFFISRRKAFR